MAGSLASWALGMATDLEGPVLFQKHWLLSGRALGKPHVAQVTVPPSWVPHATCPHTFLIAQGRAVGTYRLSRRTLATRMVTSATLFVSPRLV